MSNQEIPVNAGKPWSEEDLILIASYVPSRRNAGHLAELLRRTPHAVLYMWKKLYWPLDQLKEYANNSDDNSQYKKLLKVRKRFKILM